MRSLIRHIFFAIALIAGLNAENAFSQKPSFIKSSQWYLGPILRTNGMGGVVGLQNKINDLNYFIQLEAVSNKHPREIKILNQSVQNPKPYVFGKINKAAIIRATFGIQESIIKRNDWNKVGFYVNAQLGPSLGVLRPVYLDIIQNRVNDKSRTIEVIRYDEQTVLVQEEVVGYSTRRKGWDEMSYQLGINMQLSSSVKWSGERGGFKSLRMGISFDFFPNELPIMANTRNDNLNSALFASFMWGQ